MTEDQANPGNYHLDTTFYPPGDAIYFRATVTRSNMADAYSPPLGPFKLTRAELSISLQATSTSDKAHGSIVRAGDDITYLFSVTNKGTATARNLKVVAKLPTYLDSKTDLPKQFDLNDIPLDSLNNPSISFGGTYQGPSNASAADAQIVWNLGDLEPNPDALLSATFTLHITSKVRTSESIGVTNDYEVYGADFQPPYSATGYSSGAPKVSSEVRGPISFTAKAQSGTVEPGGLIHYQFKLANLAKLPVAHAAAVVSVPQFTRFADIYTMPSGATLSGVGGVRSDGSQVESEMVYAAGQSAPQILLDLGALAAAGEAHDSITFGIIFQAQWANPKEVPKIGAFDYYATFFNKDLFTNPYNPTGNKITEYDLFKLKFDEAHNTTSQTPGPTDFISFIQQTNHETALSYYDSGDVSVPISGSTDKQPGFILWKTISNKVSDTVNDGSTVVDTVEPGDRLTFLCLASNNGKSVANDVYIEDGLPDHTSYIKGSEHLLGSTASTMGSTLRTYPDTDGHHVRFEGLNLLPGDGVLLEYSVLVNSGVATGTLILPAAVINPITHLPEGGVGASSIGSSSTTYTAFGNYLNGAIKVTGAVHFAQPQIHRLVESPEVSTNIAATADAMTAIYNKNWSALPLKNSGDPLSFIPGAERYYIHYENLGKVAINGAQLVFPLPAHTAFYRASFVALTPADDAGVLIDTPPGSSINPPAGANGGFLSTGGKATFTFNQLPAAGHSGCKGNVMVEVIVQSDAVTAKSPLIGVGASPVFIRDTPVTQTITAPMPIVKIATAPAHLASATEGPTTHTTVTDVPQVGIGEFVPKEVKYGDLFQIEIVIMNNGSTALSNPYLAWTQPAGTDIVSFKFGGGTKQNPKEGDPIHTYLFELASNNGTVDYNGGKGSWSIAAGTSAGVTVTLKATGSVGSDISYHSDAYVTAGYMGQVYTPPNVTHIVASPNIGMSSGITGAPLIQKTVKGSDVFMVKLNDAGDKIMVLGAASIVGQGGGNIVAQGGGNIVGQGGGNLIVSGASSSITIGGTTGAAIVAQGGGNIVVPQGSAIVGQGGGNFLAAGGAIVGQGGGNLLAAGGAIVVESGGSIVAQGGGNIVGQGGGNIVGQGGGNIVAHGGGNLVNTNGSNIYAAGGGSIVTQGGGNLISLPGTSASFTTEGGNVMGVGGSNFHPSP